MTDDGIRTHGRPQKIFQGGEGEIESRGAAGVEWSAEWGGCISVPSRLGAWGAS